MKKITCIVSIIVFFTITVCSCHKTSSNDHSKNSEMTVTFFDVGKGDCILIEKDDTTVLIDSGYAATSDEIIESLSAREISTIDYFIITHYDKDHAGGAPYIMENFSIGTLYLPDYEGDNKCYRMLISATDTLHINTQRVSGDIAFQLADVSWQIFASSVTYSTEDGKEPNDNDMSLVVSAKYDKDSYLFAGDIEKDGIKSYLASSHGQYDILKVPHHGNKAGNSDELISSVSPKIAVITDSTEEPAENKLLALLTKADATTYRTSEYGTIVITGNGTGEYSVSSEYSPQA